jgi:cytidylate kinase
MKYPKITIAGDLGSGKSTVGKIIEKETGYKFFSTGDIQRKFAAKHGMTTLELNSYMKSHPEIDKEIDDFTKGLSNKDETFVLDSRMAWHFIPNSFKIYLSVKVNIAANRIYSDQVRISENYHDIKGAQKHILERKKIENDRFMNLYKVDCSNMGNYDIVIDTSYSTPNTVANIILRQLENHIEGKPVNKIWKNPKTLTPTQDVISLGRSRSDDIYTSINEKGYDYMQPVLVVSSKNINYIYDGHRRTSAAIFSNLDSIPVLIIAKDNEEIIKGLSVSNYIVTECKPKFLNSWESVHKFSLKDYQ